MKKLTFMLGCLLLFAYVGTARADVIDPRIDIGDPNCSNFHPTPINEFSNTFTFSSNGNGGGDFAFCNKSGSIWTTILITVPNNGITTPQTLTQDIICTSAIFSFCDLSLNNNLISIFLHGVSNNPFPGIEDEDREDDDDNTCGTGGIGKNCVLTINLNNPVNGHPCTGADCTGGWPPNLQFDTAANVPEPSTLLLVGSGALALWRRRRRA